MAGVVEETPFSLNLQADSLHSGSISFGRYENEALCWERRSSFSHNRYLEEVEKYSRPGSVTEKKAYFEAHFRRRALMRQTSSVSQNGTDYQSSEKDNSDFDFGSFRERSYSARFDVSPVSSISEKEFEEAECDREHTEISYSDPRPEPTCILDSVAVTSQETYQAEVEDSQLNPNSEPKIGAIEILSAEARTSEMEMKAVDLPDSVHQAEADNGFSSELQDGSSNEVQSQVEIASQPKQMKLKMMSQVTGAQGKRNTSSGSSKNLTSKPIRKKTDVSLRSTREKKVSGTSPLTTLASHRKQKHEVHYYSKTRGHFLNKSADIESRTRTMNSLRSASEKVSPKANPSANWPWQSAISTTKPRTKQNGSAFSLENDDRPDKRKEEKSEATIVHLKRSLSFKSTPMPSLYQSAGRDSDKSKSTSSDRKVSRPRSRSSSSGIETSERSAAAGEPSKKGVPHHDSEATSFPRTVPSRSTAPTARGATSETSKRSNPPESEATSFPLTVPSRSTAPSAARGATRPSQAGAVNLMTRKKEQQKETNINVQNYKVSDGSKVIKDQKNERKTKTSPARSTTNVIRKDMKGVHLGSSSRMSHLTVGVAS